MKSRNACRRCAGPTVFCAAAILSTYLCGGSIILGADNALPSATPDFQAVVHTHATRLAEVESDQGAIELFVSTIGPALQLEDVARTLGTKPLPVKLSKELLVPEVTSAAQKLVGALVALQLASSVQQAVKDNQLGGLAGQLQSASPKREWLALQGRTTWLNSLNELSKILTAPPGSAENQGDTGGINLVKLTERAGRLQVETLQAAYQEWDRMRGWKDQVRKLRGQVRLCGTWQWVIHNHQQHHHEQKLSLLFPPPGADRTNLPGLVETIVLGDNVYLRWEIDGRVQEDSLQFVKDGQRLEGTFINSQGGWGSISGKRTASCTP